MPIFEVQQEDLQQVHPVKIYIPRKVSTGAPSKNENTKNENRHNQTVHTSITAPCYPRRGKLLYTGTRVDITSAHTYYTRSTTLETHHVTTFNNTSTVFPTDPIINTKLQRLYRSGRGGGVVFTPEIQSELYGYFLTL